MLNRRHLLACLVAPVALLGFSAIPATAESTSGTLVIVTQKGGPLLALSLSELKRLYLSEQVESKDGKPLMPLNHPAGAPIRVAFDKAALDMSADAAGRYWIDRKIRGQRGCPKVVPSVDLLRRVIASLAGTLTYLRASDLTPELQVVKIDGKGPEDPGYPLRD